MLAAGPEHESCSSGVKHATAESATTACRSTTGAAVPTTKAQAPDPGPKNGPKHSCSNAGLERVVQLLENDSKRAAKLGRVEMKVAKQALRLQKESVQLQRDINIIMAQYFGNKE